MQILRLVDSAAVQRLSGCIAVLLTYIAPLLCSLASDANDISECMLFETRLYLYQRFFSSASTTRQTTTYGSTTGTSRSETRY